MTEIFEDHPGPLKRGDLIVVEIGGRLCERPPGGRPQVFLVEDDQEPGESVGLTPLSAIFKGSKVRKFKTAWKL